VGTVAWWWRGGGGALVVLDEARQLVGRRVVQPVVRQVDQRRVGTGGARELDDLVDALGGELVSGEVELRDGQRLHPFRLEARGPCHRVEALEEHPDLRVREPLLGDVEPLLLHQICPQLLHTLSHLLAAAQPREVLVGLRRHRLHLGGLFHRAIVLCLRHHRAM